MCLIFFFVFFFFPFRVLVQQRCGVFFVLFFGFSGKKCTQANIRTQMFTHTQTNSGKKLCFLKRSFNVLKDFVILFIACEDETGSNLNSIVRYQVAKQKMVHGEFICFVKKLEKLLRYLNIKLFVRA